MDTLLWTHSNYGTTQLPLAQPVPDRLEAPRDRGQLPSIENNKLLMSISESVTQNNC